MNELRRLAQSLAMLDAVLSPDWEFRYYSFQTAWSSGSDLFSMRNGSGDDMFIVFTPDGSLIKGFAHEAPLSPYQLKPPHVWPGILDILPVRFTPLLKEPALAIQDTTFCLWCTPENPGWQHGDLPVIQHPDPDGSASLLSILDGQPSTYGHWAAEYYEKPIDEAVVKAIYRHSPLSEDMVRRLNAAVTLAEVLENAQQIHYPIHSG
jgi:hypothetical protein